jgi:hypothetical protein
LFQFSNFLKERIQGTHKNFPRVFASASECCKSLMSPLDLIATSSAIGVWLEKAGTQTEGAGRCLSTDISVTA